MKSYRITTLLVLAAFVIALAGTSLVAAPGKAASCDCQKGSGISACAKDGKNCLSSKESKGCQCANCDRSSCTCAKGSSCKNGAGCGPCCDKSQKGCGSTVSETQKNPGNACCPGPCNPCTCLPAGKSR